jgi:hypothetical protein
MTKRTPAERLFSGIYPAAIVYADRSRERAGDYARCAVLPYRTLRIEFERDCPRELRALIEADAARYKAGETLQVSTCGQTVRLGP